ncbi:translation initiation factor 1 [Comamonas fluminis]|uniref:translation initiation factor 1 n=1 Tax=Comamonas fluminis TaxID=2796366 RepID=UPI001C46833C|nr:translation initiation factor 1 [Comamonas fluminis]
MLSDEMQEMHLTQTGWVAGNARYDDGTKDNHGCPPDAVLTVRREVVAPAIGVARVSENETKHSDDEQLIAELLAKYGKAQFCV